MMTKPSDFVNIGFLTNRRSGILFKRNLVRYFSSKKFEVFEALSYWLLL